MKTVKRITRVLALVLALSICGLFVSASTDSTGTGCPHTSTTHQHYETLSSHYVDSHTIGWCAAEVASNCYEVCNDCAYPTKVSDCGVLTGQGYGAYAEMSCGCWYCYYCSYTDSSNCKDN